MSNAISLTDTTVISHSDHVLACVVDAQVVMMALETGSYYYLDETGSCIWELCKEPITIGALVNELVGRFDGERSQLVGETLAFLEELAGQRLIRIEP
jgi:hypothetical protein